MTVSESPVGSSSPAGARRIRPIVALRLLEVMRDMDLPDQVLEDEDPTQTIPRRFGLSDVVERQIRTYKADVRRRNRLSDHEIHGLFRFVIRRPDGAEVFHEVGRLLADVRRRWWVRPLPRALQFEVARSTARRRLKWLFGRPIGGFARSGYVLEGRSLFFIDSDPGGDACHLVSGFSESVLEATFGGSASVIHTRCQGLGNDLCRWEASLRPPTAIGPAPSGARSNADPSQAVAEESEEEAHG